MPHLKTYRLFISHAWTYNDQYYRLLNMLREAPLFEFHNYSVPEHDPLNTKTDKQLYDALCNQVRPTHAVIILAGMYVAHRKWIQKEIDIAVAMSKPIIGIKPWGSQMTPTAVSSVAKTMVGWNTTSVVNAIRTYSL